LTQPTQKSALVIDNPGGIAIYQALVVKQGLKACKIGMRVNRAYTPTNLMAMVYKITGTKFKLKQYDEAIAAVDAWVEQQKAAGVVLTEGQQS
jgi:hypothetical protein